MRLAEARIVAHICGDGCLTTYLEKNALHIVHGKRYRQIRRRYQIGYTNTKKILLKEFEDDMKKVFNVNPRKWKVELRFRSKRVYSRITELGGGNSFSWFISKEIQKSSKKVKKEWLKAFFDDECTIDLRDKIIRVKSVNFKGLKQVKDLLSDLDIHSRITGPNIDKTWYLTIPHVEVQGFKNYIHLLHPQRKRKLESIT